MPRPSSEIQDQFGEIDIYLFDQLLKGRFDGCVRVLDAGCGGGRNLVYFLRSGFDVFACDRDAAAVDAVRALAGRLAPRLPPDHFQVAEIDALPWPDGEMDAVLASAVLHFARDEAHFERMLSDMWRVLRPGGIFFARLASDIGLEAPIEWRQGRRGRLPDGSERFIASEAMLLRATRELDAELLDPLKTTNVQNQRAMTTWCLRKTGA
ncbi:MAG TPA: class I SAM-dependent methyltransferase [Vicinamibacterales bacterium]|nr:class I SAM-dependent methyltransferase [Vicinamibacterales bacterium]